MNETPTTYFERLWAGSSDPWAHASRWYEARKYDLTVAVLPCPRYRHAVEPACGAGVLTARLAGRADRVTASDRYEAAVAAAAERCRDLAGVQVELGDVRDGPTAVDYDLAVLSECLYYFQAGTVVDVLRRWQGGCAAGGHLVLTHYRRPVDEHVFTGDEVHDIAEDVLGPPAVKVVDPDFLLAVYGAPGRVPGDGQRSA